ncbi:MAG: SpoIIE family protein phosphatase [Deltaproteobacteria bacterium]|nr:SpoIIE family protein phosphatase [Deltaproteobacteria bacterium]
MNFLRHRGIAFKLSFWVLSGVTLVIAVILTLNYRATRQMMVEKIEENAFNLAQATANRINALLQAAEKIPAGVALTISELKPDDRALRTLLASRLQQNPELFGIAAAFAPATENATPKPELYSRYYIKADNRIKESPISYDYRFHDWYQIPEVIDQPLWSEPYFGESGGIVMTSYSVPFYRKSNGAKKFAGIVCVDLSLNWLRNIVSSLKIGESGYAFLITRNGTFVTHPDSALVMNETIFSVAEARKRPEIRALGRRMIAGEKGFTAIAGMTDDMTEGRKYWLVYTPLPANGWSLGVLFPQDELMADIQNLTRIMLGLGLGGFFLIMLVILTISGKITKPLRALATSADEIATGDLDTPIPASNSGDEVGRLTRSFVGMQQSLKEYIKNLTATTAAKERIESELNIAREIQMGILPKIFPAFPNLPEFNLYATIKPAREVGGDLYDFFMIDDQHLCFTVGDVSGKGVPAALFMAITQTLIKTQIKTQPRLSAAATLQQVNNDLARDNPSLMFVTLFLGILNIVSGELEYCNGGHNSPYRLTPGNPKALQELPTTDGIALGVMEEFAFSATCLTLAPGEALFIFTDGVTEAMNPRDELFTEARLEKILLPLAKQPVREIADQVMQEIDHFAEGAPQSDDITMLVLRYSGKEATL